MADEYRKLLDTIAGKGGVKCKCCNSYKGKSRKVLHQRARRMLKVTTRKEYNVEVPE